MDTCQWCAEPVEDERRCPSCGRVQYRYAIDSTDGPDEPESMPDDVAEELEGLFGPTVADRAVRRPSPPVPEPQPPVAPRQPNRVVRTESSQSPLDEKTLQNARGCLSRFVWAGLLLFWGFGIIGAVSEGTDLRQILPGLLIIGIVPLVIIRRLRRRR